MYNEIRIHIYGTDLLKNREKALLDGFAKFRALGGDPQKAEIVDDKLNKRLILIGVPGWNNIGIDQNRYEVFLALFFKKFLSTEPKIVMDDEFFKNFYTIPSLLI